MLTLSPANAAVDVILTAVASAKLSIDFFIFNSSVIQLTSQ
jgi:hypothetical protein